LECNEALRTLKPQRKKPLAWDDKYYCFKNAGGIRCGALWEVISGFVTEIRKNKEQSYAGDML
jgi:hypothetical protein